MLPSYLFPPTRFFAPLPPPGGWTIVLGITIPRGFAMKFPVFAVAFLWVTLVSPVQAQDKVLKVVPHSNLAVLDPIWTTAYMSRNHGYMIYDTLFGTDEKNQIRPQMV